MPSTGIIQGCAALQINSFPVAEAKIFCFADGWNLAVGKAQSVSCFHSCGTVVSVCFGKSVVHPVGSGALFQPPADTCTVARVKSGVEKEEGKCAFLLWLYIGARNFLPSSRSIQREMTLSSSGGLDAALSHNTKLWH